MHKIFVPLYEFFEKHKALMYIIIFVSLAVFVFFGVRMRFEEDLTKLIPAGETAERSLAFGSIRVKDKIIVQFRSDDESVTPLHLSACADEFVKGLYARDKDSTLIESTLYNLRGLVPEGDMTEDINFDALYGYFPAFVDTSCYERIDRLIDPEVLGEKMAENRAMLEADSTLFVFEPDENSYFEVTSSMLVQMDPVGLVPAVFSDSEKPVEAIWERLPYAVVDGQLFSRDSTVAYLFIAPCFKAWDTGSGADLVRIIEDEVGHFAEEHPEVEVLFHGSPVRGVNNSRRIKKDLAMTLGLSLLIIFAILIISFKDWRFFVLQLGPVVYGTFFSLACVYWIKGSMSLMSMGVGALILGVALSYCLHLLIHNKYIGDAERMLRDESTPVVLGCMTTVGAFLGLMFTQNDLLSDFGLFASLALTGSTLFALIFLPHFLKKGDTKKNEKVIRLVDRFNSIRFDRRKILIALIAAVSVVCIAFSFKVGFDEDLLHLGYFKEETLKSEKLYSINNYDRDSIRFYCAATADNLQDALKGNREVVRIIDSLKQEGVVHKYIDIASHILIPEDVQEERIDAWIQYWTPEKVAQWRSAIAKTSKENDIDDELDLFLYDFVIADDSDGLELKDYSTVNLYEAGIIPESIMCNYIEYSADRYLVFTAVITDTQEHKYAISDAITRHGTSKTGVVMDPMYYIKDMVIVIHEDFNMAVIISSIFVLIVLLLSFKSIWSAFLAFLPMVLSWYVVQGAMYLVGIEFNLINIIVSTFIFGVGVDYSIFVMEGLLSFARTGSRNILVWHKSAIFFSATVLIIVTVSLLFAVHPVISSIGLVTLIGMVTTIVFTYTLQPFIFRQMMKVEYFQKCFKKQ